MRCGETSVNIEYRRAANAARYALDLRRHHMRWDRQPAVSRHYAYTRGLKVTLVPVKQRFCNSTSKRAKFTHLGRHVFIVWDRAQPVLMDVRFLCGGNTTSPNLSNEATLPACPKCLVVEMGYEAASRKLQ
jgi:hypothetical protein